MSLARAEQTGLWHRAPDGREIERLAPTRALGSDGLALRALMTVLAAQDAAWDAFFEAERCSPLRITYEALAAAPRKALAEILAKLGRDPAAAAVPLPTAKLANAASAAWAARLREETGDA